MEITSAPFAWLRCAADGVELSGSAEAAPHRQRVDRVALRRQRLSDFSQHGRYGRQCHRPVGVLGSRSIMLPAGVLCPLRCCGHT